MEHFLGFDSAFTHECRMTRDLDELDVKEWTAEEGRDHLADTFARASRYHQDLMEPYAIALCECISDADRMEVMRDGLRSTFALRYPCPEANS